MFSMTDLAILLLYKTDLQYFLRQVKLYNNYKISIYNIFYDRFIYMIIIKYWLRTFYLTGFIAI